MKTIIITATIAVVILMIGAQSAFAISDYQSGYNHGCNDVNKPVSQHAIAHSSYLVITLFPGEYPDLLESLTLSDVLNLLHVKGMSTLICLD